MSRAGGRGALLFVESNTSGTGALFARTARGMGFVPVLVTARPEKYGFLSAEGAPQVMVVPRVDQHALEALVRERFDGGAGVAGITTSSEYFVPVAAALAARFGLPGPDPVRVREARDKSRQREVLAAGGVPVPAFRVAASAAEAVAAAREIGFPVVLKPVAGSGSVGVRACADAGEAAAHAASLFADAGAGEAPRALVEALVRGPEFSVEVFSGRIVGITRKHLGEPPYFVEAGHDYPAQVPAEVAAALTDSVTRGTELLGLGWGPLHWELRVQDGRAVPMEVNPRLAGGFIPELVRHAEGIDLIRETLRLVVGRAPGLAPLRRRHASIRFLFAPAAGRLAGVRGMDDALGRPEVMDVRLYRAPGDELALHHDFRDRIGHVITCADRADAACASAERARDSVQVMMAPAGSDHHPHGNGHPPHPNGADPRGRPSSSSSAAPAKAMEDTGRIRRPLTPGARRIVFGGDADGAIRDELPWYVRIDRAHLVMLLERGVLPAPAVRRLLAAIDELAAQDYAPLRGRPAPRGLYLLYENHLIERLGEEVGGAVHVGRSRNDINATVVRLRLRGAYRGLAREVLRLLAVLVRRAERYADLAMPVYTHYQAALPVTYGHWLAGVASALLRDLRGLQAAAADLERSPLGAGAAGGTTVPIDPERTARLLGFERAVPHSIDAVASRDLVLRMLAAAAVLGVTLSRLAADLQLWSTAEFDLVRFPDPLVGSSSMMPQKRNAFLLEHVKGRGGAPLGAFTAAAMAMHATPFSNSVAVGTEGVKPLWSALREVAEATALARLCVAGAEPQPESMRRRAVEGFTPATELANRLVLGTGTSFRRAHHAVGEAVTEASEAGEPLERAAERLFRAHGMEARPEWVDPAAVAASAAHGGGPAEASLRRVLAELRAEWKHSAARLAEQARGWRDAEAALDRAVAAILARPLPPIAGRAEPTLAAADADGPRS